MRFQTFIMAFVMCLMVGGIAHAVPIAGHYVFTGGEVTMTELGAESFAGSFHIAGSFTSTGSALSAWDFQSDLFDRAFLQSPTPQIDTWNHATDFRLPASWNSNNQAYFFTNNATVLDGSEGRYAVLSWNQSPTMLTATFGVHATCCDAVYVNTPIASFTRVPVPGTLGLMAISLVSLAMCQWWQNRRRFT